MAVVMMNKGNNSNNHNQISSGHLQNQLTRSLERILEDAHLSGELKLSGRKLKDFPKAAGKYNLTDTVIADLSRNRFCELPDDITSFAFLETLLAYHNAIKTIPDTVRGLQSLTYLDLRNNQLSILPREICFLPLQVLLLSNNRLVSLPEELGRMDNLTELDAACNQITHLPIRIGDLLSLKSLSLRNNQLVFLPRELTCLQLVSLDISCNRIAALPVELRLMTTLVDLDLDNNPLTSPPASLCVRGLVHVFKYLETVALKEEKSNSFNGATLRRQQIGPRHSTNSLPEQKTNNRRQHVDSGYSTSDGGIDKRWLPDDNPSKYSPTPIHIRTDIICTNNGSMGNGVLNLSPNNSNVIQPATAIAAAAATESHNIMLIDEECKRIGVSDQKCSNNSISKSGHSSQSNSTDVSPEGDNIDGHDKNRTLGGIQTYREYKEALRQQRNQDSSSIYRTKDQITPPDGESPSSNPTSSKSQTSTPSPTIFSSNQSSPMSPHHHQQLSQQQQLQGIINANKLNGNGAILTNNDISPIHTLNRNAILVTSQKIAAARQNYQMTNNLNGNGNLEQNGKSNGIYIKPNSPLKTTGILSHNNVPTAGGGSLKSKASNGVGGKMNDQSKPTNRSVSWNRDVPGDKMTFTMRREIDKQKEESELIDQLRTIIESRLKMQLPEDIASALTDGVVLCYLANHVRPRSVASIHVPSPGVPKLTMARCRKNVDNFLEACRKIGVDEELICSCGDIVPSDGDTTNPPNPTSMYRTIYALLQHHVAAGDGGEKKIEEQHEEDHHHHNNYNVSATTTGTTTESTVSSNNGQECMVTATNTNYTSQDNYDSYFKSIGIHFSKAPSTATTPATATNYILKNNNSNLICNNNNIVDSNTNSYDDDGNDNDYDDDDDDMIINPKNNSNNNNNDDDNDICGSYYNTTIKPHSLDLTQKTKKLSKNKKFFYDTFQLNGITEECEYDSDIGKFNCKTSSELDMTSSELSSLSTPGGPNNIIINSYNNNCSDIIIINNYNSITGNNMAVNDLNTPKQYAYDGDNGGSDIDNLNIDTNKMVMKRIEFFENNVMNGNDSNNKIINKLNKTFSTSNLNENHDNNNNNNLSSILLLAIFLSTLIVLYLFPLPN